MNRPATAFLPRQFQFWPEDAIDLHTEKLIELYENGFAGTWKDEAGNEEFEQFIQETGGDIDGTSVARAYGLAGTGEGKLVAPFVLVEKFIPGCWPGAAQGRGDCVSHGQKNSNLVTLVCDVASNKPDEVTGVIEGIPDIPADGIKQGALSTEAIYWYRGYPGDGWQCQISAKVSCNQSALWVRKNYPDLGIDLTKYSSGLAGKYGRTSPPSEITNAGKQHLMRTATTLRSKEDIRDFLYNGYGINSCGGEGYSSVRDENGVSRRKGSWAHSMAVIGFDDRPETIKIYGEPLVLIINSWGIWNSGPRTVLGTNILIPQGAFWCRWSECKNRQFIAMSGANGFAARRLPSVSLSVG